MRDSFPRIGKCPNCGSVPSIVQFSGTGNKIDVIMIHCYNCCYDLTLRDTGERVSDAVDTLNTILDPIVEKPGLPY